MVINLNNLLMKELVVDLDVKLRAASVAMYEVSKRLT